MNPNGLLLLGIAGGIGWYVFKKSSSPPPVDVQTPPAVQGTRVGAEPTHAARQFYVWQARQQVWDLVFQTVDAWRQGVLATSGNARSDMQTFAGLRYDSQWIAEVTWTYANGWSVYDSEMAAPIG